MQEMNYGCGSTVHPRDLVNNPKVLYVGVGGGMEVLQFAYFSRQKAGVIGIDIVDEMLVACNENLAVAENENSWFHQDFVELRKGTALQLPVDDNSIDVAAQNCLFNIFTKDDLALALNATAFVRSTVSGVPSRYRNRSFSVVPPALRAGTAGMACPTDRVRIQRFRPLQAQAQW